MCLHIQETQGIGHTIAVAGTQKAVTRVLVLEKQKFLLRNIATKESTRKERKHCWKVKEVQEGIRSQNQRSKSRMLRMTYPNHGKDLEDHIKIFQAAAKTEHWCNANLVPYVQLHTHGKHQVEIHNIKQREGESTEEFVRRYKLECRDKQQEAGQKQNFKKGSFWNQERMERKQDRFTILTKIPKEILALDKGKFKPPPSMTTPIEKRNASKFCEFHGEVGHTTDECMHLKRQIEEMLKAGKLSHLIKVLKQNNGKDHAKTVKKGETLGKDKSLAILMVQAWQRVARQRITQTFSPESIITFPPLGEEDGIEGPMIIEAEMGGHCVHRMYVDEGSSLEILYEHCFNRFRPEVKNQMVPSSTLLVRFSGEIIWPLGQISLLVKIGDEEHSTFAWINVMVVRSPSPYNGIIGRPWVRKIRAIPSTVHGMLKFPVVGGIVTLRSSMIIPLECLVVLEPGMPRPALTKSR
ncbi:reverse transcriptase domain-containing protein [Tanacetum coccineum]